MNYSEKDYRKIGIISAVAIAIAAMMIPGTNLANIAYASDGNLADVSDRHGKSETS